MFFTFCVQYILSQQQLGIMLKTGFSLYTKSMYFTVYFHVKAMKSQVNLVLNHFVCVDNVSRYDKDVNKKFCKWHLEKWILKHCTNFNFFSEVLS